MVQNIKFLISKNKSIMSSWKAILKLKVTDIWGYFFIDLSVHGSEQEWLCLFF